MTADAPLTLHCPAKVNLALSIGAPDDTGYHPLASWMIALTFGDSLTLRRTDSNESRFNIGFADDAPRPGAVDWPLASDLAYRAHQQLEQATRRALPVDLTLAKRIPIGAGLGGGSSDAAGVLVGLNELFELNLTDAVLYEHAAALGSDVPFLVAALRGTTSATATGRGERLRPAPLHQPIHLALVLPELACATGAVYKAFDQTMRPGATADEATVRAIAARSFVTDEALFNDLAEPACAVAPELRDAQRQVAAATDRRAHVTGSGAAMFVLADDAHNAHALAHHITARTGLVSVPAQSLSA